MYQTMVDNSGNKQNKGIDSVTAEQPNYTSWDTRLISITDYIERPTVIKDTNRITGRSLTNVLLFVMRYPRSTGNQIRNSVSNYTMYKALPILLEMGYIREIGKPRLIKPFQRFKVDRGYMITDLGKQIVIQTLSV